MITLPKRSVVPGEKPIALVVASANEARKARLHLARIGFDNVIGYITADALTRKEELPQIGVEDLKETLGKPDAPLLVDVRTATEWKTGHIDGARHLPLSLFVERYRELPKDRPSRSSAAVATAVQSPPVCYRRTATRNSRMSTVAWRLTRKQKRVHQPSDRRDPN